MYLGRVVGTVVAQTECEGVGAQKLLLVQPVDHERNPNGGLEVAIDTVRAGPGDLVFLVGSREAALALEPSLVPVDAAIVGIGGSVCSCARRRGPSARPRSVRRLRGALCSSCSRSTRRGPTRARAFSPSIARCRRARATPSWSCAKAPASASSSACR